MLDRPERSQERGRVHEAVETAELRAKRPGHVVVVDARGLSEVERKNRGLRMSRGDDLVVERLELAHDAAVQDDGRAPRRTRERDRLPEAARRAGDQNGATGEVGSDDGFGMGKRHGGRDDSRTARTRRRRPFAKPASGRYNFRSAVGV